MKKLFFITVVYFYSISCYGNKNLNINIDTILNLVFYKLSPANQKTDSVQFQFNIEIDTIVATCYISPLWFVAGTQKSDFINFETPQKSFTYFNTEEFRLKSTDTLAIYELKFKIPKSEFRTIFLTKVPKVIIIFSPNPNVEVIIKENLKGKKISVYEEYCIELSKKDLKAKISKPNLKQLEEIRNFLNKIE